MTAAVYRTTQPSLSLPQTQNTAPVLEFACLYTHDIRRKQKRWQDGFLRFHTFNKRVMVYDVPRNFIGDAHWKGEDAVAEGDELTLEREGVMVEVGEGVGRTETDLTELVGKRRGKGGSSERGSSPIKAAGVQTPSVPRSNGKTQRAGTQPKHRSLNALLGTPKGPLGKAALPIKSPFEERHADVENEEWEDGRPPKRQRAEQTEPWNVTRATKAPEAVVETKESETPLRVRTADAAKRKQKAPTTGTQQTSGTKEVIELSDGEDEQQKFLPGFSSDALAPLSSPAKEIGTIAQPRPPVRSSSPALQSQKLASNKKAKDGTRSSAMVQTVGKSAQTAKATRKLFRPAPRTEPTQSVTVTKERALRYDIAVTHQANNDADLVESGQQPLPSAHTNGQSIRLTARPSKKKKTLLCQNQLTKKPARSYLANTENAIGNLLDAASQETERSKPTGKNQRKMLQERLAKIRPTQVSEEDGMSGDPGGADGTDNGDFQAASRYAEAPQTAQGTSHGDATTLAELDQIIFPREEPRHPSEAPPHTMAPSPMQDRHLRKVVSDVPHHNAENRAPGAPVRFTSSPSKRASATPFAAEASPGNEGVSDKSSRPKTAVPLKARSKKSIQRSVSLNTAATGTSEVIIRKPFQPPKATAPAKAAPRQPEPWSREAFDLFSWRPPGWDEEKWCATGERRAEVTI